MIDKDVKQSLVINKVNAFNRFDCLGHCGRLQQCHLVSFNSSICILYSYYAKFYIKNNSHGNLFEKKSHKNFGLVNYWPIENGEARDLAGGKDLYDPFNTQYTQDRHGSQSSVLNFNLGFIKAPAGIYFGNEFTVLAWVKLKSYARWQRFFDFANGLADNNILVALSVTEKLSYHLYNNDHNFGNYVTSIRLDLHVWYHLGFTLKNGYYKIYLNSILAEFNYTGVANPLNVIVRNSNYFGKSNWAADSNGDFMCDEIKFFDSE
ncbi:glycoside hydrolase, partial [Brachionus plicatilis]